MIENEKSIEEVVTEKTVYEIILLVATDNFSKELTKSDVTQTPIFFIEKIESAINEHQENEIDDDLEDLILVKNWLENRENDDGFNDIIDEILIANHL